MSVYSSACAALYTSSTAACRQPQRVLENYRAACKHAPPCRARFPHQRPDLARYGRAITITLPAHGRGRPHAARGLLAIMRALLCGIQPAQMCERQPEVPGRACTPVRALSCGQGRGAARQRQREGQHGVHAGRALPVAHRALARKHGLHHDGVHHALRASRKYAQTSGAVAALHSPTGTGKKKHSAQHFDRQQQQVQPALSAMQRSRWERSGAGARHEEGAEVERALDVHHIRRHIPTVRAARVSATAHTKGTWPEALPPQHASSPFKSTCNTLTSMQHPAIV